MPAPTPTPSRRRPRPLSRNALAVYATSAALFASVFGFLGLRVAQGQDPSLGAGALSAQVTPSSGAASHHTGAPLRTSTSGGSPSSTAQNANVAAQGGTQLPGGSRHDD